MNSLIYHGMLLAQRSRLDSLAGGFKGRRIDGDDMLQGLLALAGIAAAVWALSYLLALQERRRLYSSPRRLFLSLCRAHRLRWSQRWLLWRVARWQGLRDPARLFVEPQRLAAANVGPALRGKATQLGEIAKKIYAQQSPAPAP